MGEIDISVNRDGRFWLLFFGRRLAMRTRLWKKVMSKIRRAHVARD